ncbi:type II toxin-antitoxin system RelE/ParE family toxin [Alloalcanivorax venustensis]|jgi:toxin ParE1/3/4|nr:type II toxin-antitoxin system RelE/ParE family toxin [Alloalcanivorax venustensis]MEC8880975.1 type II toxin-antitoxin system RelE/ParE family toxin [Pseudomonadota bacterium]SMO74864.1 Plasmid stabilization system protein ParE [Alcanivorax sp. DSM 26295]
MVQRQGANTVQEMMYSLTLRKEAELDIGEQFDFYEEKRDGLGHDFLLCVEEALDKLQRNPLLYRQIHKDLRRVPIRRFPHRIFYLVNGNRVIVTAVFHARKDPTSWTERA